MGLRRSRWNDRGWEWIDRVAPVDEPLAEACPDIDGLVRDAAEYGRIAVECCVEPLREMLAGLPRVISIEVEGRRRRHFRWRYDI